MANINYPFGNPSIFIVPGSASTYEYTIFNDYTIIDAKSEGFEIEIQRPQDFQDLP